MRVDVHGVDEERSPTVAWVDAHDGMRDGTMTGVQLVASRRRVVLGESFGREGLGEVVDGAQAVEKSPHRSRERLVGRVGADPKGVAAERGDLRGVEHGRSRRCLEVGRVGMPDVLRRPAVLVVCQHHDLRDARLVGMDRMEIELAETAGEAQAVPCSVARAKIKT